MREVAFDIHRQSYDSKTNRISSVLIMGGYKTWLDATLAEWILIKQKKITSFTIRQCTHTDNTYIHEKHRALLDEQELEGLYLVP
jgi:hypothetical protein